MILKLLHDQGLDTSGAKVTQLVGDGSDRRFIRVSRAESPLVVILPDRRNRSGAAESRSSWCIGRHLRSCGVPVPEIYGYDAESGAVICEDLGDSLLHNELSAGNWSDPEIISLYEQIIEILFRMQIVGGMDFDPAWCWDTATYDKQLMLSRESGYFIDSCWRNFLGIKDLPAGIEKEFLRLAESASAIPAGFFLHRDFQSRNIMLKDGNCRIIDFQGGRFGPLGYDLASLLIDPYLALAENIKERLLQKYLELLADIPGGEDAFSVEGYYLLALQRNLQILGAFTFLTRDRGKTFFRAYLVPAALSLNNLLANPVGRRFPETKALAADLPGLFENILN